jgi:tetratricopeptide (TPR) repeat protein
MLTYRSFVYVPLVVLASALIASSQNQNQSIPIEAQEKVRNGNALFDKENYAEAQKEYEAAIGLAKNWYEPHYELGQTYSRIQRPDDARHEYETALKSEPNCWICYEGLGNLADDAGDHERAVQNYQRAANLAPGQARLQYNLGIAYLRMQKVDEGIAALKDSEKLKPDYASPYFLLGNLYYEQKKYYLASDQLQQATKIEKSGPRFERAQKLNDVQIVIDEKLKGGFNRVPSGILPSSQRLDASGAISKALSGSRDI